MAIKNVKITNSRIGVHAEDNQSVMQIVTMTIQYKDSSRKDKMIELGLRKKTSLSFIASDYFGTLSEKIIELWNIDGELLASIPKPKGKIVSVYNNWFISVDKSETEAFDQTGKLVAKGEVKDGQVSLNKV